MCKENTTVFTTGAVTKKKQIQKRIYELEVEFLKPREIKPGQFFMIKAARSKTTLGRPISVFSYDGYTRINFLIQYKGFGTEELCSLKEGEVVELLGPIGNGFPKPDEDDKPCLIGGGIGVAPVAGFARTLPRQSFDFYACFKEKPYGIYADEGETIDGLSVEMQAASLYVVTESGEKGTAKGMLDMILNKDDLQRCGYTKVYACGPEPMLKYVQKICREAGVKCFLSLERHMACGMGACLGCSIRTTEGMKRVCKDGPVFPAEIVNFSEEKPAFFTGNKNHGRVDMSVKIAGVRFENPVIAASGTFGFGEEYGELIDVSQLGGICSKGLTLNGSDGNEGVRVLEVSGGMMNSIGLENPGVNHFIENELPKMKKLGPVVIANLSGHSLDDYVEGAKLLENSDVDMIELNISCPNVKQGGMAFGMSGRSAQTVTRAVKEVITKPLIVKLTPNAMSIGEVVLALALERVDAISLVNTFQSLAIDIETGRPVFNNTYAGYSGPGIKPIALRMVHQAVKTVRETCAGEKEIPVIGLGGISTWQDAVEFIMAGASAIQVGTATFSNPRTMTQIISGIEKFMKQRGFNSIEDFRGSAL